MPLSHEQIVELSRLQRIIKMLVTIQKEGKDDFQVARATADIDKYSKKIKEISPEGVPDNLDLAAATSKALKDGDPKIKHKTLSQFAVMKICPNSTDREVNQVGTILSVMEREFIPVLGDSHTKFDFSHANERDTVLKIMENMQRTLKVLIETIEEHAAADKQEFREQLGRMKSKQIRIFLAEAADCFRKFRDFLASVNKQLLEGNNVILNLDETIKFNPKYEKATLLEGRMIPEAISMFLDLMNEALAVLKMPDLK